MNLIEIYIKHSSKQEEVSEATAYGLDSAPKGNNLQVKQLSSRPSLTTKPAAPKPKGGLSQKQAAPTFTSSGMSRIDRRMAELDKNLKDDSLKLSISPAGKFQFVSKAPKLSASPAQIASVQKAPVAPAPPVNPPVAGQLSQSDKTQLSRYGNIIPLDKPTEIKPPPAPAERDYSSARAQKNMKIATTGLDVVTTLSGLGGVAKTIAAKVGKSYLPKVINKINNLRVGKVDGDVGTVDYTSVPGLPKIPVPFDQMRINRGLMTRVSK